MTSPPTLRCLFYSHVWCAQLLDTLPWWRPDALLVELAEHSHLAPVFGLHGQERPGLAPLLVPPARRGWFRRGSARRPDPARSVASARITAPGLSAPVLTAAHPPLGLPAIESAIALLRDAESRFEDIVLLVHLLDAPRFAPVFGHIDSFHLLWDIADPPSPALPALMGVLAESLRGVPGRWGGVHLCNHASRVPANADERWIAWRELLAEFPALDREAA